MNPAILKVNISDLSCKIALRRSMFNSMPKSPEGNSAHYSPKKFETTLDIEIRNLEEIIVGCFSIFGYKLVDEAKVYECFDQIRFGIPESLDQAREILESEANIILEAEKKARAIILKAEEQARQLVEDSRILRQIETEAEQIKRLTQQECETLHHQTLAEIEQMRKKCQQETEQIKKEEAIYLRQIRQEAAEYSDRTLGDLEKQVLEITKIVQNGRKTLQKELKAVQ